jgi:methionine-rich copper-binding protein CopC
MLYAERTGSIGFAWLEDRETWRRAAVAVALGAALALSTGAVGAHVFVSRTEPRMSASLAESPSQVRIWFDGPVEKTSLEVRVETEDRRRVDKKDGRLNPENDTLVEVGLPRLPAGRYRVYWTVVARDGHKKEGSFSFLVK